MSGSTIGASSASSVSKNAVVNANKRSSRNLNVNFDALSSLQFFPQAIFHLDRKLRILYSNTLAEKALDSHLVSMKHNGQIHFNSINEDKKIAAVANRLSMCDDKTHPDGMCTERVIFRSMDGHYRTLILCRESLLNSNFLLSIKSDLVINDANIRALGAAFLLSSAEQRILRMMVVGLKPKEIAYEIGISLNTVRSHLRTLYAKMQVSGYDDALSLGIQLLS